MKISFANPGLPGQGVLAVVATRSGGLSPSAQKLDAKMKGGLKRAMAAARSIGDAAKAATVNNVTTTARAHTGLSGLRTSECQPDGERHALTGIRRAGDQPMTAAGEDRWRHLGAWRRPDAG